MYGLLDRAAALQRQAVEESVAARPSTPTADELEQMEADEIVATTAVERVSNDNAHSAATQRYAIAMA